MTAEVKTEIEQVEDTLRDISSLLGRDLRPSVGAITDITSPAESTVVKIHATVEREGESPGVVPITRYTARDLYSYSDAPRAMFSQRMSELLRLVRQLLNSPEDDIEFEMESIGLWERMASLSDFLNLSPEHDEIVTVLLTARDIASNHALDYSKLMALKNVFKLLHEQVHPTDRILDEAEDLLLNAGFDLDVPMNAIRYEEPPISGNDSTC